MIEPKSLTLTVRDHSILKQHLFPGDGLEAAAILICGRTGASRDRLCVSSIIKVPYDACPKRTPVSLVWPGEYLDKAIDAADEIDGSIILIHSHPGGFFDFSDIDNHSDAQTVLALRHGSANEDIKHGSAIMIPSGAMKVRLYSKAGESSQIADVMTIGDDLRFIAGPFESAPLPFSSEMTKALAERTACVVGASGTGSIVIENLCRRGIGKIIMIDFDVMKHKNLNRILNSTLADANAEHYKTKLLAEVIEKYRDKIEIQTVEAPIESEEAIVAASDGEVIFSCVDTMEARHYCDLMCREFIVPLIDVGVTIPTRRQENGEVRIADVCGRIDYVTPDGPSLGDRGVVTPEGLHAEYLRRVDPRTFEEQLNEGYVRGFAEEAPSVLTLNMIGAGLAVEEWMARLFPYRHDPNSEHDRLFFSLAGREFDYEKSVQNASASGGAKKGRGLRYPLLGQIQPNAGSRNAA